MVSSPESFSLILHISQTEPLLSQLPPPVLPAAPGAATINLEDDVALGGEVGPGTQLQLLPDQLVSRVLRADSRSS